MMMENDAGQISEGILRGLEEGWNAADGARFAASFTDDADYVTIRGEHYRGREAVATGHQQIFDTVYRGSTVRQALLQARRLTDDVIVAVASTTMEAPSGPLAGTRQATAMLVLVRTPDGWRIAAYHNTLVQARPGGPLTSPPS
jgi:uncharacterized protein (TIGR02246 family)